MGSNSILEQLRARTDRELVALIDRELSRSLESLRSANPNWAGVEKASAEARKLLPKVYNLGERLRLERKLGELQAALAAIPVAGKPGIRAAAG